MAIRLIIVDDSGVARRALRQALGSDRDIEIVGEASGGDEAVRMIERLRPDLVTMDLVLGDDDGIDVTAALMRRCPVPIVIVTARDPAEPGLVYAALQAGALEVCAKLPGPADPAYEPLRARLVRLVKALAKVPVVHRFRGGGHRVAGTAPGRGVASSAARRRVSTVVIGASTGGPPAVAALLAQLPRPFSLPVVVAQHLAVGFSRSFVDWLVDTTGQRLCLVDRAMAVAPGWVYMAPADRHVAFCEAETITPVDGKTGYHTPSIDVLFASAARRIGSTAAGVILTGMGDDGARGMTELRAAGAVTVAQEPSTCVVASMPERAIARGGAELVLAPDQIATLVRKLGRATAPQPGR